MQMNTLGKYLVMILALLVARGGALSQQGQAQQASMQPEVEQVLALANQARGAMGAGPLKWDQALADAARKHCLRMTAEGPISHRYPGELDLTERAGQAGAHFNLIEENVAIGPTPAEIHDEWMHSPGHRSNLLNPEVDRVGIAVVASRGVLYATADYAHGVKDLTPTEIEAQVATLLRPSNVAIGGNAAAARTACAMDSGVPRSTDGSPPGFVMRWQDSELNKLPEALAHQLASGQYRQAAVGSCRPSGVDGTFTAYRVAVLLY
jgi:hypothetical protein